MPKTHRPRFGSLQFWPRKKAIKIVPRINWDNFSEKKYKKNILGFLCYKVGMVSILAKDLTANSMTKGKQIIVPATVLECPAMKVLSVRFLKKNDVVYEVLSSNIDKELKSVLKLPKNVKTNFEKIPDYDNVKLIVYSTVKETGIKKTPDLTEIGLQGNKEEKLELAKNLINKEINVQDVFDRAQLVDARGVTKGKGTQGPVKRFGIGLKSHKSEKGVRRPGSLGPWFPHRVIFNVPMMGQLGFFTRGSYNHFVLDLGSIKEKNINPASGFKQYGNIKSNFIIVRGSIMGTQKRPIILTQASRSKKYQERKSFEVVRVI